jgi:hypothetical protein
MLQALKTQYEAEMLKAEDAIQIILNKHTAVAEHPTAKLWDDLDEQIGILADRQDKLDALARVMND